VGSARCQRRIEILRAAGAPEDRLRVLGTHELAMLVQAREHHIGIVHLAEQILDLLRPAASGRPRTTEAERGGLEHVAQALRGDPHVVLHLRLVRVESSRGERTELPEAHLDYASGVLRERSLRIESLHLPRLHATSPGSSPFAEAAWA